MNYLFFTRSNGDVDCMPFDEPISLELTTMAKKRKFIGDAGATNFKIFEESNCPINAILGNGDYVTNPKDDLKKTRSEDAYLPVEYPANSGRFWQYNIKFALAALRPESRRWKTLDNKWKLLTPADMSAIADLFAAQEQSAYDAYIDDMNLEEA